MSASSSKPTIRRARCVEVCGRCTAAAVLAAIARRVAGEGRIDDKPGTDGADQNIDAQALDAAGAGIAPAGGEIS
jgi:hypothetical protein